LQVLRTCESIEAGERCSGRAGMAFDAIGFDVFTVLAMFGTGAGGAGGETTTAFIGFVLLLLNFCHEAA